PRDRVRLEDAHPNRQLALPFLIPKDDHRYIRSGIDDEAFDRHFDVHGCPQTLCGPARSTRTGTVRPIHSAGPGRLTTTFVLRRPKSSVSRRRLAASTSTSTCWPMRRSFSEV